MRWRVGLADVTAAIVVAVVIVLPPREAKVANAYFDHINQKPVPAETLRTISTLQGQLAADPSNALVADELADILSGYGQTDDALRVAGSAAAASEPDNWRALLALAAVHSDRVEFKTARSYADKALEACGQPSSSCLGDGKARIRIFADELDRAIAAVAAGHNPRIDPQGFREALGERRLPPIRVN